MNIFLLIGQSNMAGRGRLGEVPELRHEKALMWREGKWVRAVEPIHTDKPERAAIGLGMSFAVELIDNAGMAPIGLVPCAMGSSPLSRWMPRGDLYEIAVNTTRNALENGQLAGILWHQGEADSGDRENATSYGERLQQMLQRLRSDLDAENAPFIAGELGRFLSGREGSEYFDMVNRQLRGLESCIPAFGCVSSQGLTDNGDNLHFNAASLRGFGVRYARRFLDLTEQT